MKTRLKKLFCDHVYQLKDKVLLESSLYKYKATRVYNSSTDRFGELRFVEKNKYALFYICLKCGSEKIEESSEEVPSSKKWEML